MEYYLKTSDSTSIQPFLENMYSAPQDSHKGQNGKMVVIGGSTLFHAAFLWAAEAAAYFVDMLHYASTKENNEIVQNLKSQFRNGIVIEQKDIPAYVKEDDAVLIGPGMIRGDKPDEDVSQYTFPQIVAQKDESLFSYLLTQYLLRNFPEKRFVLDAGALQMMKAEWLKDLTQTPIICPHQLEFERLFGTPVKDLDLDEKKALVKQLAGEYKCVIILKAVVDIISDGTDVVIIEGGNPGLTKGGSGDVLGGIITALYTKNKPLQSAVVGSFLLKKTADILSEDKGNWYNISNLIDRIPATLQQLVKQNM